MTIPAEPFDKGLQAERTLLSWRRTSLSIGAGSVGAAKLFLDVIGPAALVLGGIGLAGAVAAYLAASSRYRRAHASLHESAQLTGGALPHLALAGALVVIGIAAFVTVLTMP